MVKIENWWKTWTKCQLANALYVAIYLSLVEKWWYMKCIVCGGENTLHGGQDCFHCHNVFFSKVPCLNVNHLIIMKDFHNFLHIMVNQNPKKSNAKKISFKIFIWCDVRIYDTFSSSIIDSNVSIRWKQRKEKELRHVFWFTTFWCRGMC